MSDRVLVVLSCGTDNPNRATRALFFATVAKKISHLRPLPGRDRFQLGRGSMVTGRASQTRKPWFKSSPWH